MGKLTWAKDMNGVTQYQPPCPKRGYPALNQRGFWSTSSPAGRGSESERFVIEPVYSNSATKAWFHIVHYTLSDGADQIYFKGRTVKDCKVEAEKIEKERGTSCLSRAQ